MKTVMFVYPSLNSASSTRTIDYYLLFDGRLDNRAELLAGLGMSSSQPALSDAALLLHLIARWGADCLARLVGPFALALYDRHEGRVTLARDAMGVRSLFYHLSPRLLAVASEAQALLAHPAISTDINETGLARWYALHFPLDGQTIYQQVNELPPAHALSVEQERERLWTYWQPVARKRIRYRDESEYAQHYRDLLAESVRCRLRSTTPPAVMMSGGYDSMAVASLAALELAESGREQLRVFSWIFDELTSCDERPQIEAVNAAYNTQATFIAADEAYPLRDWDSFPLDPGTPATNAYRPLLTRTYRAVSKDGSRVLLTGASGDNLFSGAEYWLLDLLREGRPVAAWRGLGASRQGHPRIHRRMRRAAYWRLGARWGAGRATFAPQADAAAPGLADGAFAGAVAMVAVRLCRVRLCATGASPIAA